MLPSEDEVRDFLSEPKRLAQPLEWRLRRGKSSVFTVTSLKTEGLIVGRFCGSLSLPDGTWNLSVDLPGAKIYRSDRIPPGGQYKHRNKTSSRRPSDPRVVRDLHHEHVWRNPAGDTQIALGLEDATGWTHQQFFLAFCERATIDPAGFYREPIYPQEALSLDL